MRRRDMAREAFENERLKRLDSLGSLLTDFRDVDSDSKKRLFKVIQDTPPLEGAEPPKLEIVQAGRGSSPLTLSYSLMHFRCYGLH